MNAGNVWVRGCCLGICSLVLLLGAPPAALAETPEASCANDSLFLISPEEILLRQQTEGRRGLVISWRDLNLEEATCFALSGHEDLGYPVSVEGGFGDQVDRQFLFTTTDSGSVSTSESRNVVLSWTSQGTNVNGILSGLLNLSNNGGVLQYVPSGPDWNRLNADLPMTWRQTNAVTLDVGSDGFMLAAFSAGQSINAQFRGLHVYENGGWIRIAEDIFPDGLRITKVAVSPENNDHFAVGTAQNGLYLTTDGGITFQNWAANLDPLYPEPPTTVNVSALEWGGGRIWLFAPNFGLFTSEDNGVSFGRSDLLVEDSLDEDEPEMILPGSVYQIAVNPSDGDHILVGVGFNGLFQSFDGGETWNDTYGDLLVPDPDNEGAWNYTAEAVLVDPTDADILLAGMRNKGVYRSADGGDTWTRVAVALAPENLSSLANFSLLAETGVPGTYYCLQDGTNLIVSTDFGATWNLVDPQPTLTKGTDLVADGSGGFIMATWGGGIYEAGSPLALSDTYDSGTSSYLRDLDLGLDIFFEAGVVDDGEQFILKCQTFQGWAVWRAPQNSPDEMTLIGVYDRVNPEACIEGYCGDVNFEVVPQCYNSKRAACFDFSTPDSVRFFDEEIYNGFAYYYAVTSYDYGNTALSSPQNNNQIAVYSPRWTWDSLSPFEGVGNRSYILLNDEATDPFNGDEVFVYPNPLREEEGLPGQEGETVVFTNLPPGARVRVFTPAGDDVINLGPDNLHGGNIYWRTRNRDEERVSAGVYLYKVEMPERQDHWGRLVIIR